VSHQTVLQQLQELGGIATVSEIATLARERYPNLSLSHYVGNRLRKLKKWDYVGYDAVTDKYFVVNEQVAESITISEA
jgi:hypothetical protein